MNLNEKVARALFGQSRSTNFKPATNFADAWAAVEKMGLDHLPEGLPTLRRLSLTRWEFTAHGYGTGSTPMEAICNSILHAHGDDQ